MALVGSPRVQRKSNAAVFLPHEEAPHSAPNPPPEAERFDEVNPEFPVAAEHWVPEWPNEFRVAMNALKFFLRESESVH